MATRRDLQWVAAEFDRRASTYDASRMHRWQAELAVQLLDPQPGQLVLDVATGTGLGLRAAAARTAPTTRLVGIDASEQMLRAALQHSDSERQTFVRADAHRLPFLAAVFDAILCVAAVPYLQLSRAAAQWRRVARSGGVVVFTTPAAGGLSAHRLLTDAAAAHNITVPDPHAALGSEAAIRQQVQDLGLIVEVIVRHSLAESLQGTPEHAFTTSIDYGFAGTLEDLPDQDRQRVFATYRDLHLQAQRAQQGSQDWLFTRCRFP